MSLPMSYPRLLAIVCTGLAAALGLTPLRAGLNTLHHPEKTLAAPAVAAGHPLRSNTGGVDLMFVSLPGIGNAVMSVGASGKPVFSPVTLHKDELTFSLDGHMLDLSGIDLHVGTSSRPTHLLLHLDPGASRAHLMVAPKTAPSRRSAL